ncbi:MAG: zf-TFIIB domain-containing protein [Verrucomicrobiota bacterium]
MLNHLECPRCQVSLVHCANEFGNFWACGDCEGTAVTVSLLRKFVARDVINTLWQAARSYTHLHRIDCPGCQNRMEEVPLRLGELESKIDVCGHCQFVWLDAGEWDELPHVPVEEKAQLSKSAREQLALVEMERVRQSHELEFGREEPVWGFWDLIANDFSARAVVRLILSLLRR